MPSKIILQVAGWIYKKKWCLPVFIPLSLPRISQRWGASWSPPLHSSNLALLASLPAQRCPFSLPSLVLSPTASPPGTVCQGWVFTTLLWLCKPSLEPTIATGSAITSQYAASKIDLTLKAQAVKKNSKLDFIKIKFYTYENNINRVKRQLTEWQKIFAHIW